MKQSTAETYNVAWFKLAECVSRGEKERALGVYRLLAHSLNDKAFATQLQGDILLSFSEREALEVYQQAVHLYIETGRLNKAACVYEHMLCLNPEITQYREALIALYASLNMDEKVHEHTIALQSTQIAGGGKSKQVGR